MENSRFSVQITLDGGGVRSVRVLGDDWHQSADAHCLLQRLSPLIAKLDIAAREKDLRIQEDGGATVQ
jgi:hypothetical protein